VIPAIDRERPLTKLRAGHHPPNLWVTPAYLDDYGEIATEDVWLRAEVVQRIAIAVGAAATEGMSLLIWDGWRSAELQHALYEDYRARIAGSLELRGSALEERVAEFVTDPARDGYIAAHTTGGAVDLTLCSDDGKPLDMGSEFDELSDRAHPTFYTRHPGLAGAETYSERRALLHSIMSEAGFWRLDTEWWHFEYGTPLWASSVGGTALYGPVGAG